MLANSSRSRPAPAVKVPHSAVSPLASPSSKRKAVVNKKANTSAMTLSTPPMPSPSESIELAEQHVQNGNVERAVLAQTAVDEAAAAVQAADGAQASPSSTSLAARADTPAAPSETASARSPSGADPPSRQKPASAADHGAILPGQAEVVPASTPSVDSPSAETSQSASMSADDDATVPHIPVLGERPRSKTKSGLSLGTKIAPASAESLDGTPTSLSDPSPLNRVTNSRPQSGQAERPSRTTSLKMVTVGGEADAVKDAAPQIQTTNVDAVVAAWTEKAVILGESENTRTIVVAEAASASCNTVQPPSMSQALVESTTNVQQLTLVPQQQIYIPLTVAKSKLAQVVDDMQLLRTRHAHIVQTLEVKYQALLAKNNDKFSEYVASLRRHYDEKVAVCYKLLDTQRQELEQRIKSLAAEVKTLEETNNKLIIDNTAAAARLGSGSAASIPAQGASSLKNDSNGVTIVQPAAAATVARRRSSLASQPIRDAPVATAAAAAIAIATPDAPVLANAAQTNIDSTPSAEIAASTQSRSTPAQTAAFSASEAAHSPGQHALIQQRDAQIRTLQDELSALQQTLTEVGQEFARERAELATKIQSQLADITKLKAESQAALVEAQQELSTTKLAVTAKEEALARQQQEHAQALEKIKMLQSERLAGLPIDAADEIQKLQVAADAARAESHANQEALSESQAYVLQLEDKIMQLQTRIDQLAAEAASQAAFASDAAATATAEIARLQTVLANSAAQERLMKAQEDTVRGLRAQLAELSAQRSTAHQADGGAIDLAAEPEDEPAEDTDDAAENRGPAEEGALLADADEAEIDILLADQDKEQPLPQAQDHNLGGAELEGSTEQGLNSPQGPKPSRKAKNAAKTATTKVGSLAATSASSAVAATGTELRRMQADLSKAHKEIERLSQKLEATAAAGGPGGNAAAGAEAQRLEKKLRDSEKHVEAYKAQESKNREKLAALSAQIAEAQKQLSSAQDESHRLKVELKTAQDAASQSAAMVGELEQLKKTTHELKTQNATLQENFNSERVLRKKYYNMMEDMKGKVRVYCRVRPLSNSEKERGNFSVVSAPDEFTAIIANADKREEFGFDAVYMPDSGQDMVYQDTGNLIQSAVDGYNVCIFAYGQTGSGKTFTMIGDSNRPMKYPGLAPRAFEDIFRICEENKGKYSFRVSCYMIELYCDKLIDLFAEKSNSGENAGQAAGAAAAAAGNGPAEEESKLRIRKDKNGLVVIENSVVRPAASAADLYALFEQGSESRHVASTKMNAESSRSHLIIGILIESTNLVSGVVTTGKLSLVDLAGSERAGKTGATGQQIIEAKSINKSLSALGNVIFALSENAAHVPYRDNLLTQLMQDSLGGNAKTLMFVNVSPADYNTEETINSLKYARRVKLITNDAKKNADNKEVARLKDIIKRMRQGETISDEDLAL